MPRKRRTAKPQKHIPGSSPMPSQDDDVSKPPSPERCPCISVKLQSSDLLSRITSLIKRAHGGEPCCRINNMSHNPSRCTAAIATCIAGYEGEIKALVETAHDAACAGCREGERVVRELREQPLKKEIERMKRDNKEAERKMNDPGEKRAREVGHVRRVIEVLEREKEYWQKDYNWNLGWEDEEKHAKFGNSGEEEPLEKEIWALKRQAWEMVRRKNDPCEFVDGLVETLQAKMEGLKLEKETGLVEQGLEEKGEVESP